ncbi:AtpZ/AtpI family protein [Aporhodopirellula aestuarii]|uniref:AtpZ/AtpI family protein n=1 Tax=Aporhodopirellula aestuarii TaxID=2950107 RepID=A0ABT0U6Y2_9BACT|nr:AtpZ/AtpI family protein [Aporhodopirellula aestuarii]MCM2372546.1 AtpZ/AtpI family protein [Aporhodopirellula aestuarii]
MIKQTEPPTRIDPRFAVRRDAERLARREQGHRSFWRSLGVIGMVGWPIAMGSVGGSLLGRFLDARYDTGIRFTLILMSVGVAAGTFVAWRSVVQKHD